MRDEQLQHDLFAMALRASNIIYWEYDLEKGICYQGGDLPDYFGLPIKIDNFPEDILNSGSLHPKCVEEYKKMDRDVRAGKQGAGGEFFIKGSDGVWRWFKITYTIIFDEQQKPYWAMGIANDITLQKEMEARYQDEMMYHEVLDSNLLASFRMNLTKLVMEEVKIGGEVLYEFSGARVTLDSYEHFLKYVSVQEEKKHFYKLLQRERLLSAYAEGKTKIEYEHHIIDKDGVHRWVCTSGVMAKKPGLDEVILFIYTKNIDSDKITQEMLSTVAALDYDYFAIIDGIANTIVDFIGKESGTMGFNSLNGKNYDAERIRQIYEYVVDEEQDHCMMETSLANIYRQLDLADSYVVYVPHKLEDGTICRKKLSYFYMDRESRLIIVTRTDVTSIFQEEQRKNELLKDALKAAEQANMAKGEFLSKMSHEIRTPMNAILGLTSIALRETDIGKMKDNLDKIDVSAKFLLSLINDILDMTRIESGKVTLCEERIEIKRFLEEIDTIIRSQTAPKGIHFVSQTNGRISKCYIGDTLKLQQVLLNILGNAVKFTDYGGTISLNVEQIRQNEDMATLRFIIKDNGIGISENFLPHLFEPFSQEHMGTTNSYAGTGLGLAICQNIVNMMSGKIRVKSRLGVGTEFVVDVMIKACENVGVVDQSFEAEEEPERYDFTGKRVLLVEDNEMNMEIARILLEEVGFMVEAAKDGSEAVDKFWKCEPGYYDAVLMDIRMPVMDGLSATINIRGLEKPDSLTVPIIAMTANAFAEDMEKSKASGMNAHLSKPIDTKEMYRTLSQFIYR